MKPQGLTLFLLGSLLAPQLAFAQSFTPPPAPVCTLTATPSTIVVGDRSRLQWTSKNASRGTLTVVGNIAAQGSVYVTPNKTTDYIATFTGAGGTKNCTARVTVMPLGGSGGSGGGGTGAGGGSQGGLLFLLDDDDDDIQKNTDGTYTVSITQGQSVTLSPNGTYSATGGTIAGPTSITTQTGEVISLNPNGSYVITAKSPSEQGSTPAKGANESGSQSAPGAGEVGPQEVDTGGFPTGGSLSLPQAGQTQGGILGGLVPNECRGDRAVRRCDFCALGQLLQNIINWLLAISILIAAVMFAYAGILLFTSAGSLTRVSKAKSIFLNVAVGFFFAIGGWLFIQTILSGLVKQEFFLTNGKWNSLDCNASRVARQDQINKSVNQWLQSSLPGLSAPTAAPVVVGQSSVFSASSCRDGYQFNSDDAQCFNPNNANDFYYPTRTGTTNFGTYSDLQAAMQGYYNSDTSMGPDGGNKACAWAINNVLVSAGLDPIDHDSVSSMEKALQGGRGTLVDQSSAGPGDIVIFGIGSHVGMCQNVGCTEVLSNSSSQARFSSVYAPSYGSRIYTLK